MKIIFYVEILIILTKCLGEYVEFLESTGNCEFAAEKDLTKVGTTRTHVITFLRWIDIRALDEEYTLWETQGSGEHTKFVSFGRSHMFDYNFIKIQMPYKIFGRNSTSAAYEPIHLSYSEMHCLRFKFRYLTDLHSSLQHAYYDPKKEAPRAVLHYSKKPKRSKAYRAIVSSSVLFTVLCLSSVFLYK